MVIHVLSGFAAIGVVTAYQSRAHTVVDVWTGRVLYGIVLMYTCLGVSLIKESIPALRRATGDIRDEACIMATARAGAARDGMILAAIAGSTLLATPWHVDAGATLGALVGAGLVDFFVRQVVARRRLTRGGAERERNEVRPRCGSRDRER